MSFKCIELLILVEEFGCTITFSDTKTSEDQFKTDEEIMNSEEKYLLIQRTYGEDEYDSDSYYLESSETITKFDTNEILFVTIEREKFKIDWTGTHLEIGINLTKKEVTNLREILESRFKDRIKLIK